MKKVSKLLLVLLSTTLWGCAQNNSAAKDNQKPLSYYQELSEKTGVEMIVIKEAEKITGARAEHFKRWLIRRSYAGDPIQPTLEQPAPKTKTVLLPGISFFIDHNRAGDVVDSLNRRLDYRRCIAFISDDTPGEDKKQTVSLIYAPDKYNTLRLQETSGGSYLFSTDSLITKLKAFENKYPFRFVGVGRDWIMLKPIEAPKDWIDYSREILRICPSEEVNLDQYARDLQKDGGKVTLWWD